MRQVVHLRHQTPQRSSVARPETPLLFTCSLVWKSDIYRRSMVTFLLCCLKRKSMDRNILVRWINIERYHIHWSFHTKWSLPTSGTSWWFWGQAIHLLTGNIQKDGLLVLKSCWNQGKIIKNIKHKSTSKRMEYVAIQVISIRRSHSLWFSRYDGTEGIASKPLLE